MYSTVLNIEEERPFMCAILPSGRDDGYAALRLPGLDFCFLQVPSMEWRHGGRSTTLTVGPPNTSEAPKKRWLQYKRLGSRKGESLWSFIFLMGFGLYIYIYNHPVFFLLLFYTFNCFSLVSVLPLRHVFPSL